MIEDLLYQLLLVVLIVAGVLLSIVLWKIFAVMDNVKQSTEIANKRIKQLDANIENLEGNLSKASDIVKGFVTSLETTKSIKEKIKNFLKN